MYRIIRAILISAAFVHTSKADLIKTTSPDGSVVISFMLNRTVPQYSITYRNTMIVNWSSLGLDFINAQSLGVGLKLDTSENREINETYPVFAGKSRYAVNHCIETKIILRETTGKGRILELYFRAYDDGAAFRYGIPEQNAVKDFTISTEESNFNFKGNYNCWAMKRHQFKQSYEGPYLKYKLSNLFDDPRDSLKDFPLVTLPLTMEVNTNLYLCLSEANITDYAGMYLVKGQGTNSLKSVLSPDPEDNFVSVRGKTPAVTPWRVLIIGDSPGSLIESNLIMNLNEPVKIPDAGSWVKAGKSLWGWWAEDRGFDKNFGYDIMSYNTMKYYVDFCAQNNIEYNTIDAGWYGSMDNIKEADKRDITRPLQKLDLPDLVNYANSKGVGIFLWVAWYDLERQLTAALDYYQMIGVKGIKVDFMERDDQYMVNFYHRVAEETAKRKILVNFHGAYKPDGLERTYPNLITREAVLGNEYSRWISGLPNPKFNVTIPFTRMVAGGMDYTPGCMLNSTREGFIGRWQNSMTQGTRAQQLAMFVVYESGIISLCESPKIYEKLPEFDFVKQVPARWDTTVVTGGNIGDYISIARKKGSDWFVGAMTDWTERDLAIDFSFLEGDSWSADIYQDAADANTTPSDVSIYKSAIKSGETRNFHLAMGGGLAIILRPSR